MRLKDLRLNDVLSTHMMVLESTETFQKTREVRIIRCFEEHKHTGNEGEVNLEVGGGGKISNLHVYLQGSILVV